MATQHRTISGAVKKENLKNSVKKTLKEVGKSAALATGLAAAGGAAIGILKPSSTLSKMNKVAQQFGVNPIKSGMKPMAVRNIAKAKYATKTVKTGKLVKTASKLAKGVKVGSALGMGAVAGAGAYGIHRIRKAKKEFDKANAEQIKAQNVASKMAVEATKKRLAKKKNYAKNKNR